MDVIKNDNRINFYWAILILACALLNFYALPQSWSEKSISDSGIFSFLTIFLVAFAFTRLLYTSRLLNDKRLRYLFYALAYLTLIYALREADFHRAVNSSSSEMEHRDDNVESNADDDEDTLFLVEWRSVLLFREIA